MQCDWTKALLIGTVPGRVLELEPRAIALRCLFFIQNANFLCLHFTCSRGYSHILESVHFWRWTTTRPLLMWLPVKQVLFVIDRVSQDQAHNSNKRTIAIGEIMLHEFWCYSIMYFEWKALFYNCTSFGLTLLESSWVIRLLWGHNKNEWFLSWI